ncbi:MAG: Na/Pi symporter [Rhodospirillum sp.]|nr:Na/Pi symporter [Rhodospirillum sp.]
MTTILGGLGLFFIGVKLIGDNLKRMTGKRFRSLARKTTNSPIMAAALGTLSGALTQSTSAVTFIAAGLVTAGLVEPRKAMPLVIWSNLGTAALVMAATLNIHAFILSLLAVTGLCYFMDLHKATQWRALLGAMLGLGLLFLGLDLMKSGTEPLRAIAIVRDFVTFSSTSLFIAFLIGALLTLVAQSSATVSVIAVTLVSTGILGMDQTVMIIYGAGVGSGLSVWFLASNLTGTPKRLINLQMVTKMAGGLVLVPLFLLEKASDIPLVLDWVAALSPDPARQAAWIYLIYQISATVSVTLLSRPLATLIEKLQPPNEEEALSRPQFLQESALQSPETTLDLVDRELARMVFHLIAALDNLRLDMAHRDDLSHHSLLLTATQSLGEEIQGFLADLTDQDPPREAMEGAVIAQNRVSLLLDLRDTIEEMIQAVEKEDQIAPEVAPLAHALLESLHLTLGLLAEEIVLRDPEGLDTLVAMTADRSDMMERTRRSLIHRSRQLDLSAQELLFATTAQFERAQWLIHRCARLTRGRDDAPPIAVPSGP